MGFSRQENWSGLLSCLPGDRPHLDIEMDPLMSPALASGFFFFFLPLASPGKPPKCANHSKISNLSWGQGPSTCVVCSGRHVEDTQEILGGKKEREGAGEGEESMEGRREERRKGRRAKPPKWTPQLLSPAGSSVRTKENQESCMQGHPHPLGN